MKRVRICSTFQQAPGHSEQYGHLQDVQLEDLFPGGERAYSMEYVFALRMTEACEGETLVSCAGAITDASVDIYGDAVITTK